MLPPIRVLCRFHLYAIMHSLKASMQPEYSHIVDAAVQYAKVRRLCGVCTVSHRVGA